MEQLPQILADSQIFVLTGAGISKESQELKHSETQMDFGIIIRLKMLPVLKDSIETLLLSMIFIINVEKN